MLKIKYNISIKFPQKILNESKSQYYKTFWHKCTHLLFCKPDLFMTQTNIVYIYKKVHLSKLWANLWLRSFMILVQVHWKKLHPHWLLLFYSCQILNPIWNTISSSRQKIFHFDFFSQKMKEKNENVLWEATTNNSNKFLIFLLHFIVLSDKHSNSQRQFMNYEENEVFRGCIFSHLRPFYERDVSNLDP